MNLIKNYIKNEEALEGSIQLIVFIVIALAVAVVIGALVYNALASGKGTAESGLNDFDGLVGDINGLK